MVYRDTRTEVLEKGCYSPEENARIYNKWFKHAPRYLFRAVDKKYHITKRIVCDIGCGYGMNLLHCEKKESYGLDIDPYQVDFGRSLGSTIFLKNAVTDDLTTLPKAEVVWCSAMLEHVDAPHIVLRKLHSLLKPNGLACIYVPTQSAVSFLRHVPVIGRFFEGYIHGDHINAFSPKTIRFMCERAGFRTREVTSLYPGVLGLFNAFHLIDGIMYIGEKIDGWEYPETASRLAVQDGIGYVPKHS